MISLYPILIRPAESPRRYEEAAEQQLETNREQSSLTIS